MIEAKDIFFSRTGKNILQEITVAFPPNQLSVILGPNGAGKSTLLKILSGALTPDSGEVYLEKQKLSSLSPERLAKRRGVLAQETFLQFDFSVEEVVLLGRIPHLTGWESDQDHEICRQALASVDMLPFAQRKYPTLSGGEKQRVNLARILAQLASTETHEMRKWILLDEPTSALDLRHQHTTLQHVKRMTIEEGLGAVAVLHDLNLAMRYADQILLLSDGCAMAFGNPRDVLRKSLIEKVYGVRAEIHAGEQIGCPFIQTCLQETITN